ncbi:MAG TPA: endolytic transglycosylase MltG [Desulfobacteraceae bacterium]|nr:endolytic transglycosylase MltG [Desulfobacteraceae bacterium]
MTEKNTQSAENHPPEKKGKKTKKVSVLAVVFAVTLLATLTAVAAGLAWMNVFLTTPPNPSGKSQTFVVTPGQSLNTISQGLKRDGLITDALRFKILTLYKKAATRIKTGEYTLSPAMTPDRILAALLSGRVKLYRFTVPEGLNMFEISVLAETAGFCTSKDFLTLCRDNTFISELNLPDLRLGQTLEGYLYPDTYYFPKNTDCRTVIEKMVQTFETVFTEDWKNRATQMGFSVHDIVTLASIVEKETGKAEERPLIASVFHNRLKRKMRLESDPTVIYNVDDYHGRIRYKHLRRKTPYNTYQIHGLPLGPIANPGALALEAVLYPAKSDYLFFVSKNDTTHQFSTNLRDHNKAVRKYQLGGKSKK